MTTLDLSGLTLEQKYEKAGQLAGVPAQLFAGMWQVESAKGTNMTSRAGARGHFQTMPDTQATLEARTGRTYDPDNFDDSLTMAAMVMQENMRKFKTIPDALQAYNSGWDRSKWGNAETSAYVGKIYDAGEMISAGGLTMAENAAGGRLKEAAMGGDGTYSHLFAAAMRGDDLGALGRGAGSKDRQPKEYLSDVEKGVINQAGVDTAAAYIGSPDAVALGTQARLDTAVDAENSARSFIAQRGGDVTDNTTTNYASSEAKAANDAAAAREKRAQELTINEKWGSHFTSSLTAGLMRRFENEVGDFYPKGYDYAARAQEVEAGYNQREREQLRESNNLIDEANIKDAIRQQRADAEIHGLMSTSSNLMWGVSAGFSDPAGWAAGFGVGKAAQIAGVGARAYALAGRPLAAFASAGVEGAAGNVLTRATLDAMGDYTTVGDYVMDAAVGLGLGAVMSAPGIYSDVRLGALQADISAGGAARSVEIATKAQELAGPDATPDQLHKAMGAVVDAEEQSWALATLGNVDNENRLFARADVGRELEAGETNSIFSTDADRLAFIEKHDLHNSIADDDMRAMVAEVFARAQAINKRIDLSPEKLKTFLQKFDLEATSTTMLNSKSDVARAVAAMLMENPEGAAGRRSTASISRSAHFEMYMGNIQRNSDQLYSLWAKEQGVGAMRAALDLPKRRQFNREVQLEMDRRWNGRPEGAIHPMVRRAADLYDEGYRIMGRDQKIVGTIGADAIDLNTKGYFQRSWNLRAIRELSQNTSKRNAFLNALEDQFRTVAKFTDGPEFKVRNLAIQYLARLEHKATGQIDVPSNIFAQDAGVIVKDALHSLGMSKEEIENQMKKFTRGASGHTKNRIDMDYSRRYSDGAGNEFLLVDFLDQDMNSLYRKYAAKTSGDVALAKYGIMGNNGLAVLREAMEKTGATVKELRAFEQWSAEMTGKQFGAGDPLLVQNARLLTNLTRMGGAIFPQMGAFVDAVSGLGVARALKLAGSTNRMRKEVQALARGEKVDNSILGGFEGIGPEFGTAEYRIHGLFDTGEIEVDIAGAESIGRGTQAIRAGAHVQRIMSGHRWVTAAQTRGVAEQIVRKAMRYMKEGGEDIALTDMGINPQLIARMKSRMKDIAEFDSSGELVSFNPLKLSPDDLEGKRAVIEFRDTVLRGTNQIMNKEFPGEAGKWAHNGWLKLLFQFRTFSMVAQQKQFNRILHTQGAVKLVGLMVGGMAVAAPIHMARVGIKASLMKESDREEYIKKNLHPLVLGRATMNYLSSIGLFADVAEAASGLGAGWADAFNMDLPDGLQPTGGRMMRDTNMIGGQFAPSLGVINDIGQGVMGKADKGWKTAPFASLPYFQPIIMGMDSHLSDD